MTPSGAPSSPRPIYDPWRHRFAVACACATGTLLFAGGLVTSTGSGLAVPDWPLSFGQVFPKMEGGVLFEHGHRLIAASVGLLTIGLAAWFARSEPRRWMRRLAALAVAVVIAQGVLGGITVLWRLPLPVSVAHACMAQGFFCLMVFLALATSRGFVTDAPAPIPGADGARLQALAAGSVGALAVQLVLGALVRHGGAGLAIPDFPLAFGGLVPPYWSPEIAAHFAHRAGAAAATVLIFWTWARLRRRHAGRRELLRPAGLALAAVALQIALGGAAVLTRLAVVPATLHLVNGAVVLACAVVLAARVTRARPQRARRSPVAPPVRPEAGVLGRA